MTRIWIVLSAALVILAFAASGARADRRYFVQSYTPYLGESGELELEAHSIARSGQGDSTGTAWENRIEFEYGVTDRLTGAMYLNFVQPQGADASSKFDGPSLELIYQLSEPGELFVDPAAYFEVRANGSEVEMEPKLLLGKRIHQLVTVVNLVGEFEHVHAGEDKGTTEKALGLTVGMSREIGKVFAIGLEGVYTREFQDEGPDDSRVLLGPTINLQTPKIQLALGWHPQITGNPESSGGLNLTDFPRSEVRLTLGVDL